MNAPLIALTGATGFIGRHLLAELPKRGYRVRVLLRRPSEVPAGASSAVIGDIASPHNMAAALRDVDMVIHSAGLAHAMSGRPEDDYRTINTEATIRLAQAAERAGVKRFVFLSSIRAQTGPVAEGILTEGQEPQPTDALWPLEARGRAGPGRARPRLGGAPPGARLRARREGQHGGPAGPGAIALAAAARRPEGASARFSPSTTSLRRSTRC